MFNLDSTADISISPLVLSTTVSHTRPPTMCLQRVIKQISAL